MKSQSIKSKIFFSSEEDKLLIASVNRYGSNNWIQVSKEMGSRTARQCRDRWRRYLDPRLNCSKWTSEDDEKLQELYSIYGSQWKKISEMLGNRSDLSIKNRFFILVNRWRDKGIFIKLPPQKYLINRVHESMYLKEFEQEENRKESLSMSQMKRFEKKWY